MKVHVKFLVLVCLFLVLCSGCVSKDVYCGHELNSSSVAKLKANKTTKQEVLEILGNPSCSSTFDDNVWYYIHVKRVGVTPFKKGISLHKVLQLNFKNNILVAIKMIEGSKDAYNFSQNKTYVHGDDISTFKDFIDNLGKYNQKKESSRS